MTVVECGQSAFIIEDGDETGQCPGCGLPIEQPTHDIGGRLLTDGGHSVSGTYEVTLDNPGANSRTHVRINAEDRRDARRCAKREYPRHVVQKVRSVDEGQRGESA